MRSISNRRCSKKKRRANRQVAQALGRVERSAEIEPVPISDVDLDLLHESRRPKPSYRAEADSRNGERKTTRAVWAQSLKAVPRAEGHALGCAPTQDQQKRSVIVPKRTLPPG